MKNQILDEPIHDSFSDFLEKGETILWQGEPINNYNYTYASIWFLVCLSLVTLSIWQSSKSWLPFFIFLTCIVLPFIYANFKNIKKVNKIRYAITQHRVFFRQLINQKTQINSISFEYIPRVYLNNFNDYTNRGDISFLLKKPAKGKFWTYHIGNNQAHELPTFEQIENPKKVMELLQRQIKASNNS